MLAYILLPLLYDELLAYILLLLLYDEKLLAYIRLAYLPYVLFHDE
jgi:hypothetical protein